MTALGANAIFVAGSVADAQVADELVATCIDSFGKPPQLLINNAGVIRDRTLVRMSDSDFDDVVATHLRGSWLASRAAARVMTPGGGAILNIVSGSALFGLFGQSNYAAAKGGMIALTRALSVELHTAGIAVNALYPAALTDMTRTVVEASGPHTGALPDFHLPDQVAPIVTFLASADARNITGQVLSFDGRTLTVWSHPAPAHTVERDVTWTSDDIGTAFRDGSLVPEPLHPDAIGLAVREALAASR